jgi:hypothetical protein
MQFDASDGDLIACAQQTAGGGKTVPAAWP